MKRHAKKLQAKAQMNRVAGVPGAWLVESATSGETYQVFPIRDSELRCTCDWSQYHPAEPCTHRLAVTKHEAQKHGRRAYFWSTEKQARKQHKKMKQIGSGLWMTLS
jgi:hypothetical protein